MTDTLRTLPTADQLSRRSMLEVVDELRDAIESGRCKGFALAACLDGRPAREQEYVIMYRVPGLMPCEVVYVLEELRVTAATSGTVES